MPSSKVSTDHQSSVLLLSLVLSLSVIFNWCTLTVESQNLICRRIPKLNPLQVKICSASPELLPVIRSGIQLAIAQCERLFSGQQQVHPAWNCSSWIRNSTNRLFVEITHPEVSGTKEASFAHALFSAGVTYALSEACTRANFSYCSCGSEHDDEHASDEPPYQPSHLNHFRKREVSGSGSSGSATQQDWKWQGCKHNVDFGTEMARLFLDSHEQYNVSPYSLANLHNNLIGRRIVREEFVSRCQCHGYSGSCSMRTCWRTLNVYPQAATTLYDRYRQAKEVTLGWLMKTYRARLETHYQAHHHHQKSRSGVNIRSRRTKLDWLARLQAMMATSSQLEMNQPNVKRKPDRSVKVAKRDLIYVKQSVNFCALSAHLPLSCEIAGSNSTGSDVQVMTNTCKSICCGRGYRPKSRRAISTEQCDCRFKFCCSVECQRKCPTPSSTEYECL